MTAKKKEPEPVKKTMTKKQAQAYLRDGTPKKGKSDGRDR